jgi:hypothetical protein
MIVFLSISLLVPISTFNSARPMLMIHGDAVLRS